MFEVCEWPRPTNLTAAICGLDARYGKITVGEDALVFNAVTQKIKEVASFFPSLWLDFNYIYFLCKWIYGFFKVRWFQSSNKCVIYIQKFQFSYVLTIPYVQTTVLMVMTTAEWMAPKIFRYTYLSILEIRILLTSSNTQKTIGILEDN